VKIIYEYSTEHYFLKFEKSKVVIKTFAAKVTKLQFAVFYMQSVVFQ